MDLNELYKEIEKAEVDLNAKRLEYIREALAENNGIIKLKFKGFKEFKETNDAFDFDKEIFMQPENKNKIFILGTRKTGCDLIVLGGTNCDEGSMDWLFWESWQ